MLAGELAREGLYAAFLWAAPVLAIVAVLTGLAAVFGQRLGFSDVAISAVVRTVALVLGLALFGAGIFGGLRALTAETWAQLGVVGRAGAEGVSQEPGVP